VTNLLAKKRLVMDAVCDIYGLGKHQLMRRQDEEEVPEDDELARGVNGFDGLLPN